MRVYGSLIFLFTSCAHTPYVSSVDHTVKKHNAEYRACFDRIYKSEPVGTTDGLRIQWMIEPDGGAKQIKAITQTRLGTSLGQCIGDVIQTIHFAQPDKETFIRYPFVFTKRKSETDTNF